MKTKLFSLLLAIVAGTTALMADRIQIGDLYYELDSENHTAMVTYKSYAGDYNHKWNITSANIPASVTYNTQKYSVTSIGSSAFSGCSGLTSVTIPNSVTIIGESAFSGCSSLTSVTIPNSVTSIGGSAFANCISLTSITIPNSVTGIGESAFSGCSGLTSVTIPNSVTSIGSSAFSGCSGLTSVTIPNSVTNIGDHAFSGCSSLTSITLPNSVTSIGDYTFYYCSDLKSISIPNSVTSIGNFAFCECRSLTSIEIPNSVTSIGEYAFSYCASMTSVTIPNSVTSIGSSAFYYCNSLTSIEIPNSVTSIGDYAFSGCSSLTSVVWNAKICVSNSRIWVTYDSNTHQHIGNTQITSFTLGENVEIIPGNLCFGLMGLTIVNIPNSVTSIGSSAFYYCNSLTSIEIPNSVTSIGDNAFYGCSGLTSLTIGSSVAKIGNKAFAECANFEWIICYASTIPTITSSTFENIGNKKYIYLYVPEDRQRAYLRNEYWGEFDVQPISATSSETEDVQVTSTETTADIAWPTVTGAASYELVIRDQNGDIICTLVFNSKGQLTSITFNAPGRDNAPDNVQTAGFSFTVSGLDAGTTYNYTLTAKDSGGNILDTRTGSFKTAGTVTAVEETEGIPAAQTRKVMRDGAMYILMPDGRMYDAQGTEL